MLPEPVPLESVNRPTLPPEPAERVAGFGLLIVMDPDMFGIPKKLSVWSTMLPEATLIVAPAGTLIFALLMRAEVATVTTSNVDKTPAEFEPANVS